MIPIRQRIVLIGLLACILLLVLEPTVRCQQQQQQQLGHKLQLGQRVPAVFGRFRLRRQAGSGPQKFPVGQLSGYSNQVEQTLLEADELKRQLPDLIAQAHNDKTLERALLRMVISASLRGPNNQQQQNQLAGSSWQLDNADQLGNLQLQQQQQQSNQLGDFVPLNRLTRLDSNELASLESQLANVGEPELAGLGLGQFQSAPMDKREYIKPCSFNAISCVRTPFRRLK